MTDLTDTQEIASLAVESSTLAILNKSEIDQQIATAKRFPRALAQFRKDALAMATLSVETAGACIYSLPRDGKTVEGPSARFAEIVASSWGNCRVGARVMTDQGDFVTAQGCFTTWNATWPLPTKYSDGSSTRKDTAFHWTWSG